MSALTRLSPEQSLAAEEADIDEIVRGFLALQARGAGPDGRLRRGTHAKGVCVGAEFEVFDVASGRDPALAARLAKGIYARPGIYPATVRFSNSDPKVNSDFKPDVRAMSFAVELANGGATGTGDHCARQDYSLQSATTLPINDVHAFAVLARVLGASSPARILWSSPFRDKLIFASSFIKASMQTHQRIRPYQHLRYWGNVPFRHGAADVVKHAATPSAGNSARPLERNNPNALQDELIRHVNEDTTMSSFDFGLQLLDPERMTYRGKRGTPASGSRMQAWSGRKRRRRFTRSRDSRSFPGR